MREQISKQTPYQEGVVLVVDKPLRWTSSDVVRKIKYMLRKLGYPKIKIGHAGTLDPLATGVLVVCIGRATKRVDELQAGEKEYVADVMLGATTPSGDLEHPVDATYPTDHITREMVEEALRGLCGERFQLPPVYSAKMIDGRRAYDYAREGEQVEMRRSLINIYEMEILDYELPLVRVRVRCSKGTYIRSLAFEIGEALGSGAHLVGLRRTRSGEQRVEEAYTLEEVVGIMSLDPEKELAQMHNSETHKGSGRKFLDVK
ncbi:MAG: tRNA pseudouridine(55) synthase TruB [Tidjanibacter sp.]|nr:tRNA pseudouridine(55) synthase TruB [Tidjanibacter sp.]